MARDCLLPIREVGQVVVMDNATLGCSVSWWGRTEKLLVGVSNHVSDNSLVRCRMANIKFTSLPSFPLLGYHLKVLYAIDYFGHALLSDIERTFPGDEVQRLEITTVSIKVGKVAPQVVQALIDLIEDDLITLYVKPYRIEVVEPQGTLLYLLGQMGEIPVGLKTKLLQGQFEEDFSFQGAGYWCNDPDTSERIELTEHGILAHISLTNKGREVWSLLRTVHHRLLKEVMMAAKGSISG